LIRTTAGLWRQAFLEDIKAKAEKDTLLLIGELLSTKEDGRIKLYLIREALKVRRENKFLFQEGDYVPLDTAGPCKDHVIAYARRKEGKWALTVAPRFFFALAGEGNHPMGKDTWKDTALLFPGEAPEKWRNALTGEIIRCCGSFPLAEILRVFPVALLVSEDNS
jgi:(1->4)-alpha-D-glucan 1-alpha-D-glucosylmutase